MIMPENGYKVIGYYPSWASYPGKSFPPSDIPVGNLTHLIYAFAEMKEDGQCDHYDKYADVEMLFPGDDPKASGNNTFGNVQQIVKLKNKNRHLKTIISIGGWRLSGPWSAAASTPERRTKFVETCMHCMYNFGWDGIDLAWVFPKDEKDAENYVLLVEEFRKAIDEYKKKAGTNELTLSAVAPAREDTYKMLKVKEMDQYLDFWNMMAYDFNGKSPVPGADSFANHSAPMKASTTFPESSPFSIAPAMEYFINSVGINPTKLNLGISLYGRAFYKTKGPGHAFGAFENDWQQTLFEVKKLPMAGAAQLFDDSAQAAYSYDSQRQMMVSYENSESIKAKVDAITNAWGLGGAAFWDVSADAAGERSLIAETALALGGKNGGGLDYRQNTVHYPFSDKDNVRNSVAGLSASGLSGAANGSLDAAQGEESITMRLAPEMIKQLFPFLPERQVVKATFSFA